MEGGNRDGRLLDEDLEVLGLDHDVDHLAIRFNNEKSTSYSLCMMFLVSLSIFFFIPIYLLFLPCCYYCVKSWANSRRVCFLFFSISLFFVIVIFCKNANNYHKLRKCGVNVAYYVGCHIPTKHKKTQKPTLKYRQQ